MLTAAKCPRIVDHPLEITWNGHDWEGDGSRWMNTCFKEIGWLILPWPRRAIIMLRPPRVRIEVQPTRIVRPAGLPTDGEYLAPVQRFRFLGLRVNDTLAGVIYAEE